MLIPVNELTSIWRVKPTGIIHVGAHEAEERDAYLSAGWKVPFLWVEAQNKKANQLKDRLPTGDKIVHAAAWSLSGVKLNLNVTNNSQSTSVLKLKDHSKKYPDVVVTNIESVYTVTLDDLVIQNFLPEFIALDIQGAELEALKGAQNSLAKIKWVYTEVNKKELYSGCCLISDIDSYLKKYEFVRVATKWVVGAGWGDALYIKNHLVPKLTFREKLLWYSIMSKHYAEQLLIALYNHLPFNSRNLMKKFFVLLRKLLVFK